MNTPELKSRLLQLFPVFQQLPPAAVEEIGRSATTRQVPASTLASSACQSP